MTIIYDRDQEEYDARLDAALESIKSAGLTLNKEKCEFSQEEVSLLGQVVEKTDIRPDPNKVKAIVDMEEPTDQSELRRFLGMANQLGKFSRHVA